MQEVDRLGWAVTVPLRAGEYVLGLRVNDDAVAELVREVFVDRVVEDASPPANLSLLLAPPATDGTQELHRLYETYTRTLRTRSVRRALAATWHELDSHDRLLDGSQVLADVAVVVRDGHAHLLDPRLRRSVVDDERRWQRDGFALVDRRTIELDPAAGTITVATSPLDQDGMLSDARIASLGVDDRPGPTGPTGTYPIASWTLTARDTGLGQRTAMAAGRIHDLQQHDGAQIVRDVADLLDRLQPIPPGWNGVDELRERLREHRVPGH